MAAHKIRSPDEILDAIKTGTASKAEIATAWASHQGFIRKMAGYYRGALRTSGEEDDLISESFFAFVDAAKAFDKSKGSFLPWFALFLHKAFQEYCAINSGRSRRDQALLHAINVFITEYERDHGRKPALSRISEELSISEKTIENVMAAERIDNLEEPTGEDLTLLDNIPDEHCLEDEIIESVMRQEISKALMEELNALPVDERKVVYALYFRGFSYESVADYFGKAVSEIKNARERAMRKLRAKRVREKLRRIIPDNVGSLPFEGSLSRFIRTGTSVTEGTAIKLMINERRLK